jgi:hypothetical protein
MAICGLLMGGGRDGTGSPVFCGVLKNGESLVFRDVVRGRRVKLDFNFVVGEDGFHLAGL